MIIMMRGFAHLLTGIDFFVSDYVRGCVNDLCNFAYQRLID